MCKLYAVSQYICILLCSLLLSTLPFTALSCLCLTFSTSLLHFSRFNRSANFPFSFSLPFPFSLSASHFLSFISCPFSPPAVKFSDHARLIGSSFMISINSSRFTISEASSTPFSFFPATRIQPSSFLALPDY